MPNSNPPSTAPSQPKASRRGQKLVFFLQNMSPREWDGFRAYLESPLLGNSAQGVRLLDILLTQVVKAGLDVLPIEVLQEEFFPAGKQLKRTEEYVWIRISNLQEKLLDYLAFLEARADTNTRGKYLLRALRDRSWEKYIPMTYQKSLRGIRQAPGAATTAARLDLEIEMAKFRINSGQPGDKVGIEVVMDQLDSFYVIQKLKYACAEFNQRLFGNPTLELRAVPTALEMADHPALNEIPVVQAYRHACAMLQGALEEEEAALQHYEALKKWLESPGRFAPDEAMDLFTIAQNYAVRCYYQGVPGAMQDLKSLYDQMLASGVVMNKGFISGKLYKNITMLMCRFGNLDWAENFVSDYRGRVSNDPEEMIWRYNQAVIHFHRGEFQKVVELLYQELTRFEDPSIGIGARIYFCRSLWMREEYEWLLGQLKSFQQYLRRHKGVGSQSKVRQGKYVRYFRKLCLAVTASQDRRAGMLRELKGKMDEAGDRELLGWLGVTIAEVAEKAST